MSQPSKELEKDSLGLAESIIMGVAGTAPAFSIAATTGALIASVGVLSIGSLFYCGLIMFGITLAYLHLNKIHVNAGAAYAWVTEIFHPFLGFLVGWALLVSSTIFMVSGTIPAATSTLALISPSHVNDPAVVACVAAFWLILVGFILIKGVKLTSYVQVIATLVEVAILLIITGAVFLKFMPAAVHSFDLDELSLTAFTPKTFSAGALTALFFFWGWDVTINLSEETKQGRHNPGKGAVIAMILTLLIFTGAVLAVQLSLTNAEIAAANTNIILVMANKVFVSPWGYLAVIAVMLSTIGTLETTIIQFTRTLFAKGRDGVLHSRYARLHAKWKTPWVATSIIVGVGLILIFLSSFYPTVNKIIEDSVSAISFQVAFYFSITGFASVWKFRKLALENLSGFLTLFLWPLLSSCFLVFIGIYSLYTFELRTAAIAVGGIAIGIIPYTFNALKNKA